MNTVIISAIFDSIVLGVVIYVISLAIALSPIGEWILRIQTVSKKIERSDYVDRLMPLFDEIMIKGRQINSRIARLQDLGCEYPS